MPPKRNDDKQAKLLHVRGQLHSLKSSIVRKPPYCQGTLPLPDSDFTLFYGKEGNAHRINLSTAPTAQLQHLADTCAPATFGVAGEDVYDETYRKAGKLDSNDFSIGFDVDRSSLVDVIRSELLVENPMKARSEDFNIELYKLNVYGKNAFFKAHVDTPRSELMFGSLVIVFPTPHEGGALKLRAPGAKECETMEWTFDSSTLLAQLKQPSIAYVAFFSDTEHEVMPVTSGHRVTITYNLYYVNDEEPSPFEVQLVPNQISTNETSFRDALRTTLGDDAFLPEGGNLMFGLSHQYPLATSYRKKSAQKVLKHLELRLKASDGVMLKVLRECGLDASLKILYEVRKSQWSTGMCYLIADGVLNLPHRNEMVECSAADYLESEGAQLVEDGLAIMARELEPKKDKSRYYREEKGTPVLWVTDPPIARSGKGFEKTIQTYGNEPTVDVVYWRIWIFARVGPAGNRKTASA